MQDLPILRDIFVTFGLTILVLLVCHRLNIPTLVGIIFAGVLAGPTAFQLIENVKEVKILAEIGVIILLFTIGMEISLKRLFAIKRQFFLGGITQVGITLLGGYVVAHFFGRPFGESIFLGCLLALSSTAIVLKLLIDRLEENSPHGKLILSILIFQDVIAVPIMLFIPVLAGAQSISFAGFLLLAVEGVAILAVMFVVAEKVLPFLFYHVAKTASRELFLLTVLFVCSSVTWLAASVGLSLSLGAFLAGLILSDTEYRHQAIGDILPFQDVFTSFFFISIGMLLDVNFLYTHPWMILLATFSVITLKVISAGLASFLIGVPLRTVIIVAFSIFQIGEFSFVLMKAGMKYGLGTSFLHQIFLSVSLLTMMLTPILIKYSPVIANFIGRLPLPERVIFGRKGKQKTHSIEEKENHVIIAGFGASGKHLAYSCKKTNVDYVILEMTPEVIAAERVKGEPIYFGDVTHASVLRFAGVKNARVLVVAINDPIAARQVIMNGRALNENLIIIARTRHLNELKRLYDLGADYVVSSEFEASVSIFSHVLRHYFIGEEEIENLTQRLRNRGTNAVI